MTLPVQLNDEQFIQQFESLELDKAYFNHRGHLRLAWLYITQYGSAAGKEKLLSGIKAYATSLGAADKFHYSLTKALSILVSEAITRSPVNGFEDFCAAQPTLVNDSMALISHYYSDDRLNQPKAKQQWVAPDLKVLPSSD